MTRNEERLDSLHPQDPSEPAERDGSPAEAPAQRCKKSRRSWWPFRSTYDSVVNAIIRPPRAEYRDSNLGPKRFLFGGHEFMRTDLQVQNRKGLSLECSWWKPKNPQLIGQSSWPCVVCLHGNSSCRLEALQHVRLVLMRGITVFAFDFAGCGQSEGDHITLGYNERDDVQEVIKYLRQTEEVSTIALWGRSMGAATALLHGHRDPSIAALILDSPFASLEMVVRELIDRMPIRCKLGFMVNTAMGMVRRSVRKRTGMDILKLKPIENVHTCFIPSLFIAGVNDELIDPHHTHDIYEAYAGDKNIVMIEGDHNSQRPQYLADGISIFLYERLCLPAGLPGELPQTNISGMLPAAMLPYQQDDVEITPGISGQRSSSDELAVQEAILMSLMTPADTAM